MSNKTVISAPYFNEIEKNFLPNSVATKIAFIFTNPKEVVKHYRNGYTQLHVFAYFGYTEILQHKDVAKVRDYEGNTPLHILGMRGYLKAAIHQLAGRVKNRFGKTPLHYLAYNDCGSIINHKDIMRVKNKAGRTPMDILIGRRNLAILDRKDVAKQNWRGISLLHKLAANGVYQIAQHPLAHVIREYKDGYTPLHVLAIFGDAAILNHEFHRTVLDFHGLAPFDYYAFDSDLTSRISIERLLA